MDNHRRRFVTSSEEDRISKLQDNLTNLILERLPLQDAVRTCILSTNWRYKWTTITSLVLDKHFSEKFAKNGAFGRNGFIRITNHLFNYLMGPILKVYLYIPKMFLDSFQEVDQWIFSLSKGHVRELNLLNSNNCYRLPSYLFRCLELRKLQLDNCIFKPPLEFPGFLYLEDVFLINIEFGANLSTTVIELPELKKLHMISCTNVHHFNIKATKMQTLLLNGCPDALLLALLHYPCLTRLGLAFNKSILVVEKMNCATNLINLPYLVFFTMDGFFLKLFVAENISKWLPNTANSLKILKIVNINFGDLDQLQGALYMLQNSPNLERLHLKNLQMSQHMPFDVSPASRYLEASNCVGWTSNELKTIEITRVDGSRPMLLFIKLLLAHSPTLEKMSIRPCVADVHERLNIAKDVMQFPRASSKAKLLYLNP